MSLPNGGSWQIVQTESLVTAIHASLLPNGKVMYYHGRYTPVIFAIHDYNPEHSPPINTLDNKTALTAWPAPPVDKNDPIILFCGGHTFLADGTLLVAGGERPRPDPGNYMGLQYTYAYWYNPPDPDQWNGWYYPGANPNSPHTMADGRWYPSVTKLANGKVVAMSGYRAYPDQQINTVPEFYDPDSASPNYGWNKFPSNQNPSVFAQQNVPLYPGNHLIPFGGYAGKILYDLVCWEGISGYNQARIFDPNPVGPYPPEYWVLVGDANKSNRPGGNSVICMIKPDDTIARILNIGGQTDTVEMFEIGDNYISSSWESLNSMNHHRHNANAVVLPDGNILVLGGNEQSLTPEVLITEDPDPHRWNWETLTDMTVQRIYHSTALLLPDGRVWAGGSRIPSLISKEFEKDMERRIEIYTPYYLYERDDRNNRPIIASVDDSIKYDIGFNLTLETDKKIDSFVMISLPTVTHALDMNQRNVQVAFTTSDNINFSLTSPLNAFVAPPGYYMIFAVAEKSLSVSGQIKIPSIAKIIHISA